MSPRHAVTEEVLRARLSAAARAVPAPDVVFACSRDGRQVVATGGSHPPPPVPREELRYEIGSATKTFTGLLLATLVHDGAVRYADPLDDHLDHLDHLDRRLGRGRRGSRGGDRPTLLHAATHTAGLPRLPADFYRRALPRLSTDPYAGYPRGAVLEAYRRARLRHRPGSRWHYSNLGVAVLGHALGDAAGERYEVLLTRRLLRPLGLLDTALHPAADGHEADAVDARGHGRDGERPVPPARMAGFAPAGAVRATPGDLLRYLEAHLRPGAVDGPPAAALRDVQRPLLARGRGHRDIHTLTWFHQRCDRGGVYFHAGATAGQEAFLGFRPDDGTALVAVATRRFRRRTTLVPVAHGLLTGGL